MADRHVTPGARDLAARARDDLEAVLAVIERPDDLALVLEGLTALHRLHTTLTEWEPALIEAARRHGASWAALAPALNVTSRQAAERRYLRLRPTRDGALTGDQRVQAVRDERAGDRAVAAWARRNASALRQLAGQVTTAEGLTASGRRSARAVVSSLTEDDPASLVTPLTDMHDHLVADHQWLAARVHAVTQSVRKVRAETHEHRQREG